MIQGRRGAGVLLADLARRLEAVHFRHLHVHQNHVVLLPLQRLEHFHAVLHHIGPIAHLAEDARGDLLVDDVVLRQKNAQRAALAEAGIDPAGGAQQLVR